MSKSREVQGHIRVTNPQNSQECTKAHWLHDSLWWVPLKFYTKVLTYLQVFKMCQKLPVDKRGWANF